MLESANVWRAPWDAREGRIDALPGSRQRRPHVPNWGVVELTTQERFVELRREAERQRRVHEALAGQQVGTGQALGLLASFWCKTQR